MPVETLVASDETKKFFNELPMPQGVNGNEVNGRHYWEIFTDASKTFDDLATVTETFRRMQDFHDTINSGRFFLANAQRENFPEIYSGEAPSWANDWIKSQYVNSAIHAYSASFDIYLQILWISFKLYLQIPKLSSSVLSNDDLENILEACNINKVETQTTILGNELCEKIVMFHNSTICKEVRNLCKQIKHRQSISFAELSKDKHPIMIKSDKYNSLNTLAMYHIDDVIATLKHFHKDLTVLSDYTIPLVKKQIS